MNGGRQTIVGLSDILKIGVEKENRKEENRRLLYSIALRCCITQSVMKFASTQITGCSVFVSKCQGVFLNLNSTKYPRTLVSTFIGPNCWGTKYLRTSVLTFLCRSDRFLVSHLIDVEGPNSVQNLSDPDIAMEVEGHRSALLLGEFRLAPSTPKISNR